MTANLRRKVLKRAHEEAQKSAQKLAEKSAQKLDQKSARQRKLELLLARAEQAKREIAYYNANLQNEQQEKEQNEEIVTDLSEARKNMAIKNWYARNWVPENKESNDFEAEEPKKKKTKMSFNTHHSPNNETLFGYFHVLQLGMK